MTEQGAHETLGCNDCQKVADVNYALKLSVMGRLASVVVFDKTGIPRFLVWDANGMSGLPTRTQVSAESGIVVLSDLIRKDLEIKNVLIMLLSAQPDNVKSDLLLYYLL